MVMTRWDVVWEVACLCRLRRGGLVAMPTMH